MKFPRSATVKGNTRLRKKAIKRMMRFLHENPSRSRVRTAFWKKLRAVKVLSTMTSVLRNSDTKGEASPVRPCSLQDIRWWRELRSSEYGVRMYDDLAQDVPRDSEQAPGYSDRRKSFRNIHLNVKLNMIPKLYNHLDTTFINKMNR